MRFSSFIFAVLVVVLAAGCASRFEDRLKVHGAKMSGVGRTGIPVRLEFNHPIEVEPGTPRYQAISEFYAKFDRRVEQGLSNSGFALVDNDAPYVASIKFSCERDQWGFWWAGEGGPDNPIQLIFVTIPFTLLGGPMTSENRWSCDGKVMENGKPVFINSYVEDWKSYGSPSPAALLYMPFMGVFGADLGAGEEKMFDILAAKVVTNFVQDVKEAGRFGVGAAARVPRVVAFPERW